MGQGLCPSPELCLGSHRFGQQQTEGERWLESMWMGKTRVWVVTRGSSLLVCEVGWWHTGRGVMLGRSPAEEH